MFIARDALASSQLEPINPGSYSHRYGWGPLTGRRSFEAVCPADGKISAHVAGANREDWGAIISASVETQKKWASVPAPRRGEFVRRIGELVEQRIDSLAQIVMLDTGKSVMEAKGELREVIDMATLAAGQSRMLYGFTQQSQRASHRMYDQWLPLGVVGIISAYNFPAAVWAQNGFLSVIGGNTVVWKPSPKVPLTAIAIQKLVNQAAEEFDCQGVFSLFIPEDNSIAELMLTDDRIALVSFTGSSPVGHRVAELVGSNLGRRYMLECSGNNGCIVDETADLKQAARAVTFGTVGTTGQRCTSTRRLIVHKSVVADLVNLLKQSFEQIKVGDPRDKDTVVGPLIDGAAVGQFEAAISQAVSLGGKVVYGGKRIARDGHYVEPTLIVDVKPDWQCVQHETFAPILYIMTYETLDEAIAIHNGVPQGLASGMHSTNLANIEKFLSATGSDCGIVRINMGTTGADVGAAFGGEKDTGGGRTAGSDAWKGYMRRQSVCVNWGGGTAWDARIAL